MLSLLPILSACIIRLSIFASLPSLIIFYVKTAPPIFCCFDVSLLLPIPSFSRHGLRIRSLLLRQVVGCRGSFPQTP